MVGVMKVVGGMPEAPKEQVMAEPTIALSPTLTDRENEAIRFAVANKRTYNLTTSEGRKQAIDELDCFEGIKDCSLTPTPTPTYEIDWSKYNGRFDLTTHEGLAAAMRAIECETSGVHCDPTPTSIPGDKIYCHMLENRKELMTKEECAGFHKMLVDDFNRRFGEAKDHPEIQKQVTDEWNKYQETMKNLSGGAPYVEIE